MSWAQWDHSRCWSFFLYKAIKKHFWWRLMTSHDLMAVTSPNLHLASLEWSWMMSSMMSLQRAFVKKWATWFFSRRLIMGRSRNWPDLRSSKWTWIWVTDIKIQDIRVVGSYGFITSWTFKALGHLLWLGRGLKVAKRWCGIGSCKKMMWGRILHNSNWPGHLTFQDRRS